MKYKIFLLAILTFTFGIKVNAENIITIAEYNNQFPKDIEVSKKFEAVPKVLDYVFVTSRIANLRERPETTSKILGKYTYDTKLRLLRKVKYKENYWHEVIDDARNIKGYMAASISKKKTFRFKMALQKINNLENFISSAAKKGHRLKSVNTYVPNPNNSDLKKETDKYGLTLDQNLAGINSKGERVFIPDRSVVEVLSEDATTATVKSLTPQEVLQVNKNKLTSYPSIGKDIEKVIAIDIENQNFMVFEKIDGIWKLISYVYTKTGIDSQVGFETPKGYFTVPLVKYLMPYNDENGQKQGSAKYAIRFSGGGHVHGTPINIQEDINREFFMERKEFTLGTTTGTRKCVRTSEPHAEFLFNWVLKNPNKNRNLQRPSEKVYFIIF